MAYYWRYNFSAKAAKDERPDVVLQLSAECSLLVRIPENVGLESRRRRESL